MLIAGCLAIAFNVVGVAAPAIAAGDVFVGVGLQHFAVQVAVVACINSAIVAISYRMALVGNEPARRWLHGNRADPRGAWTAAQRLIRVWARWGASLTTLLTAPTMLLVPGFDKVTPWGQKAAVEIGLISTSFIAYLATGTSLRLWFRPMFRDAALDHGDGVVELELANDLGTRLLLIFMMSIWASGVVVASVAVQPRTTTSRFLLAEGMATVMLTVLGAVFAVAIGPALLRPLRDLADGTDRVRRGDYSQPLAPTTDDQLGDLVNGFNAMQRGLRERAALHAAFGTYVDPTLAERLTAEGITAFEGEHLVVSVMFVDIRDFTSYADRTPAAEVLVRLNRLFELIVPILRENGGHANHYLGDGVLAVFGAPEPLHDHAERAVQAAVAASFAVEAEFGAEMRIGIGINSGPVMAGTVGGGGKLEYTVIGDTVNVASRVEALTKQTGDVILLTESTRMSLTGPHPLIDRGCFEIRGKTEALRIHSVSRASEVS